MNTHENKKSVGLWVNQLFNQSGSFQRNTHNKTYFGHRFPPVSQLQESNLPEALSATVPADQLKQGVKLFGAEFEVNLSEEYAKTGEASRNDTLRSGLVENYRNNFTSTTGTGMYSQFTVLNSYDETPDTKTFRLARRDGQYLNYQPGQYITLSVVIKGQKYTRSYSLASAPSDAGVFEITVKRAPNGGVVSNWLNDHLQIGDIVNLKGPFGNFSCVNKVSPKILFLAAGSGIVPIMSMLRWLTNSETQVDVMLLLSFRTREDIIYHEELNLIARRHKNIKLFITLTKEPTAISPWQGLVGRVNEELLASLVPDVSERMVYLCGPEMFMLDCQQSLQNIGLAPEQLFRESFSVNSSSVSNQNSLNRKTTGNYKVRFARSGKTVAADGCVTVLELAEKSGIKIGNECRAGNCGECMIKCLSGQIEMTDQAEIEDFDRKKGWVYSCCSYPASNAVLDV